MSKLSPGCMSAVDQVYTYLDGELTWYKRIRIRRHLKRCNGCTDAFAFETKFLEVVREKSSDEPPPELIDRLRSFIREHGEEPDGN